uniref:TRAP transporter small permease n=1 Tax=Salmonella enterica TaxID=28901 RepID=UPI003D76A394
MTTERSALTRTMDVLDRAALAIAAVSIVGMACVEAWQVFARYVLNDSPSWTEPVALLFMSTTMMFGAA